MITFNCDAYENISYFDEVARSLLSLMGHSGTLPGAFKAEEIPSALSSLRCGLGQEIKGASSQDEEELEIDLAKRAIPLIHLLEAAIQQHCDVLFFKQT